MSRRVKAQVADTYRSEFQFMMKDVWKSVMDPEQNALMGVPKTVKFQLMVVLALLWSTIFCVSAGLIVWLPGYVVVHVVLIAIGIFGTGWIFKNSRTKVGTGGTDR